MISQLDLFIEDRRGRHVNSRTAFRVKKITLGKRALEILDAIAEMGECTDRQVREQMYRFDRVTYADMNSVRPRITELITAGKLIECGKVPCEVTNQKVRLVRVKGEL